MVSDKSHVSPRFAETLLEWAQTLERPMPWRGERDPYRIWLSEVILQQTRVAQGAAYYLRFIEAFPIVSALAQASEDDVLALWKGLGYYSRARNLHKSAQQIVALGEFPKDYKSLLKLPGVGAYTAAAIASFAYDEPVAVLDGNVYRVLARYFDLAHPIDKPIGQKAFRALSQNLLSVAKPAAYNQAIMDFGATVCTPKLPACGDCPFSDSCLALAHDTISERPVKATKIKRRDRYFSYLHVLNARDHVLMLRRPAGDIWQGLYDFPVLESTDAFADKASLTAFAKTLLGTIPVISGGQLSLKHVLTHQDIYAKFYRVKMTGAKAAIPDHQWVSMEALQARGIPNLLERYLTQLASGVQSLFD